MKAIYQDKDLLVIDKPAKMDVVSLGKELEKEHPELKNVERQGIIHRLDKDTSGVILVAKDEKGLIFFQKQFKNREVEKKYLALVVGKIKEDKGKIETLIGRNPKEWKKQRVYLKTEPGSNGKREAVTYYRVLKRYQDYTLLEVTPKTGRMHQIRCHLTYLGYPIVGDKVYGFKNQPCPEKLDHQFLHANYIKIKFPNGEYKEFISELPKELELCLPK